MIAHHCIVLLTCVHCKYPVYKYHSIPYWISYNEIALPSKVTKSILPTMIILHGINQFLLIIHNNRPPRRNRSSIGSPERINIQVSTCVGLRTMDVPCRFMIATYAISNVCPSLWPHPFSQKSKLCIPWQCQIDIPFLHWALSLPTYLSGKRLGWPIVSPIPPRNNPYIPILDLTIQC